MKKHVVLMHAFIMIIASIFSNLFRSKLHGFLISSSKIFFLPDVSLRIKEKLGILELEEPYKQNPVAEF